jgi:hypothetical protein
MKNTICFISMMVYLLLIPSMALSERYGTPVTRSLKDAITLGNSTCIPLEKTFGYAGKNIGLVDDEKHEAIKLILEIKKAFEETHPELKIINWRHTYDRGTFQHLWIDHEPRTKP